MYTVYMYIKVKVITGAKKEKIFKKSKDHFPKDDRLKGKKSKI